MSLPVRILFGAVLVGAGALLSRANRDRLKSLALRKVVQEPAHRKRYAELADELYVSGERVRLRLERARGTAEQARVLRHIVGIERWGQRRLRAAFGESLDANGHHAFKPPQGLSWAELKEAFLSARTGTVALARELSEHPPEGDFTVTHDEHGPLSARAWLRYLQLHAEFESRRVR